MKTPEIKRQSIRALHTGLVARKFAIPKLQRNFVWDGPRAAKLIDSIYHQMPVGSLFLWEMDTKSANLIRQSSGVLPAFSGSHSRISFVIDGQQRLSVLYQAFKAESKRNDRGKDVDFGRLCFVVNPPVDEEAPQRIVYRKPIDGEFVPLSQILAADWRNQLRMLKSSAFGRVRDCRDRILTYSLPVITVRSATLDEISEVFIRINSQGMRITSADRAIALMGELDVRLMAEELRNGVSEVLDLESVDAILMGFNLVANRPDADGDPPKLDLMARRWSKRIATNPREKAAFRKTWDRFQRAFRKSADYLRHHLHVHDESFLPSSNMLATLSVFFYFHTGQPSARQKQEIRKWFWATGVAQRYTGRGYHRNLVADAQFFQDLGTGRVRTFRFNERLDPDLTIRGEEYGARSARSRAFFCLLASLGPRYLDDGEPIPLGTVVSHANAKHRHHIFPRAQLRTHFTAKDYNSLCNMCFLVARDNQTIGMTLPRTYLDEYRAENRRVFTRAMRSHLIPVSKDDGVWTPGVAKAFKSFRQKRLKLICSEFEKAAGMKLFASK